VRCEELVLSAALRMARYYSKIYQRVCRLTSYQINNVHGVIDMGYPLDLAAIHAACPNSYYRNQRIKCVIMRIQVPRVVPPPPGGCPLSHVIQHSIDHLASMRPAPPPPVPALAPRKKRTRSEALPAEDEEEEESRKRRKKSVVYTVADLEVNTTTVKHPSIRKPPKDPNSVAVNIWASGCVGLMARNEAQIMAAAHELAAVLAHFTMGT